MKRLLHYAIGAVASVAAFAATSYAQHLSERGRESVTYMYDTPAERCLVKGVGFYADQGEWPQTIAGQDARQLIEQECATDVWAFGPDEPGAVQR